MRCRPPPPCASPPHEDTSSFPSDIQQVMSPSRPLRHYTEYRMDWAGLPTENYVAEFESEPQSKATRRPVLGGFNVFLRDTILALFVLAGSAVCLAQNAAQRVPDPYPMVAEATYRAPHSSGKLDTFALRPMPIVNPLRFPEIRAEGTPANSNAKVEPSPQRVEKTLPFIESQPLEQAITPDDPATHGECEKR